MVCGTEPVASGMQAGNQVIGDCKVFECDGAGTLQANPDDADLPDDMNDCTTDTCIGGEPAFTPLPSGDTCAASACEPLLEQRRRCVEPSEHRRRRDGYECQSLAPATGGVRGHERRWAPRSPPQTMGVAGKTMRRNGSIEEGPDDLDILNDGNDCTDDACVNGVPTVAITPINTACGMNGSLKCDGTGTCVGCSGAGTVGLPATRVPIRCQRRAVAALPQSRTGRRATDGDACTQPDACQAGHGRERTRWCAPRRTNADVGTCRRNPAHGICSNPNKANGASCNDGNLCSQTDTCQSGACTGTNSVVCGAGPMPRRWHVHSRERACARTRTRRTGLRAPMATRAHRRTLARRAHAQARTRRCVQPRTNVHDRHLRSGDGGLLESQQGEQHDVQRWQRVHTDGHLPSGHMQAQAVVYSRTGATTSAPAAWRQAIVTNPNKANRTSCAGDGLRARRRTLARRACAQHRPFFAAQDRMPVAAGALAAPASRRAADLKPGARNRTWSPAIAACNTDGCLGRAYARAEPGGVHGAGPVPRRRHVQHGDRLLLESGQGRRPAQRRKRLRRPTLAQAGVCTGANPATCMPLDACHTVGTCNMATGVCSNPNAPDGTVCPGGTCTGGSCVLTSCMDGLVNGSETAQDCGGGVCPTCANGLACLVNGDCASGHCVGLVCVQCAVANDCPGVDNDCQTRTCDAGSHTCGVQLRAERHRGPATRTGRRLQGEPVRRRRRRRTCQQGHRRSGG